MTVTKDSIIGALPKLSRADLEAVAAVANHLLGNQLGGPTGAVQVPATPVAAMVFDALSAALGQAVPLSSMPPATIKKLGTQVPRLVDFFDRNFKGWDDRKTKQMAFLRMMVGLIKADMRRMGMYESYNSMINNLHRMPEVFDGAFPGYRDAGLGKLILKQFEGTHAQMAGKASEGVPKKKVRLRLSQVG